VGDARNLVRQQHSLVVLLAGRRLPR
jgi:hypothetical protein